MPWTNDQRALKVIVSLTYGIIQLHWEFTLETNFNKGNIVKKQGSPPRVD